MIPVRELKPFVFHHCFLFSIMARAACRTKIIDRLVCALIVRKLELYFSRNRTKAPGTDVNESLEKMSFQE